MKIDAACILKEPPYGDAPLPDTRDLILDVKGSRMLGEIYLPSGIYDAPHPAVIVCQGIPGTNCNDDLSQALRRMGCVVFRPYHRGAWGSDGFYSFTHCLEDVQALLEWIRKDAADTLQIDRNSLFLLGHSNGGNTVINVAREDSRLRGIIAYCPFNHWGAFQHLGEDGLRSMLVRNSRVLHIESLEALYQDSVSNRQKWNFSDAAPALKDQNVLLIAGTKDTAAPAEVMMEPFWKALEATHGKGNHQKVLLPSNHSMDTCRLELQQIIGSWIAEIVNARPRC